MRKGAVLAAAAGLALAGAAKADFVVTAGDVQDAGNGNNRVLVYALNNGANGTGTRALAFDLTIADISGHHLWILNGDASSTPKPDLVGVAAEDPYHSDRTFINLLGDPSGGSSGTENDPTQMAIIYANPAWTFLNYRNGVSQFEVAGLRTDGGVDATSRSNGGKGAIIAVAVVPAGDVVHLFGVIGGDTGSAQPVDITLPTPEPASAALLLVGAPGLLKRRR